MLQVTTLKQVKQIGEGGLLGIAVDPEFTTNHFVYLYYTYSGDDKQTKNRVSHFIFENNQLTNEVIIVDNIPGAPNHNGGRIKFGPDGHLYITTGDAQNPSQSQDKNSLAGKILRVEKGKPAAIYSLGHRNPQGLTWDDNHQLWTTEHGPSGGSLGFGKDELNQIFQDKNYGWPTIQGDERSGDLVTPILHSGSDTWAPSGTAYFEGTVYFTGLRGSALYRYTISSQKLDTFFKSQFGRLREVILGPDNHLYISTSNRDGRGSPTNDDDQIIKVDPKQL